MEAVLSSGCDSGTEKCSRILLVCGSWSLTTENVASPTLRFLVYEFSNFQPTQLLWINILIWVPLRMCIFYTFLWCYFILSPSSMRCIIRFIDLNLTVQEGPGDCVRVIFRMLPKIFCFPTHHGLVHLEILFLIAGWKMAVCCGV